MSCYYFIATFLFLAATSVTSQSTWSSDDEFCYQGADCGPDSPKWAGECKTGAHQSPIDFSYPLVRKPGKVVDLSFQTQGYQASGGFWVQNNGHTIQVSLTEELRSEGAMWGYGMEGTKYIFAQIHFHWGEVHDGSEHTVAGKHWPVELHLVHYDQKYGSFANAASSGDPKGLSVLGVFLAAGSEFDENLAFDTIADHLPLSYQDHPEHVTASGLDLTSLLPKAGAPFFRYMGSLTTPNCTEAVEWTVLLDPIPVKPSEIAKFHEVLDHAGVPMGLNFRPVQPLGNRVVEFLVRGPDQTVTGGVARTIAAGSTGLLFCTVLLHTFKHFLSLN